MNESRQFGPTFKRLREGKNKTLKATAEGIMTPQFLSKFEKGNTDISLINFNLLLNRLGIYWADFIREYQGPNLDNVAKFTLQMLSGSSSSYLNKVRFFKDELPFDFPENPQVIDLIQDNIQVALSGYADLGIDPKEKIKTMQNYLEEIDVWHTLEWDLWKAVLFSASLESIRYRTRQLYPLLNTAIRYVNLTEAVSIIDTFLVTVKHLMDEGYYDDAEEILLYFEKNSRLIPFESYLREFKKLYVYLLFLQGKMETHDEAKRFIQYSEMADSYFNFNTSFSQATIENFIKHIPQINKTGTPFDASDVPLIDRYFARTKNP